SYSRARKNLTLVAEIVLEEAFRMAMKKLDRRFGNSLKQLEDPLCFAIIGLGKLGGRELTYHSDLDLIIVHSGKSNASQNDRLLIQEYGVKLIQRTIFLLTTITRSGFAYTMDTRLRPSGNAGVLVTPWEVYFKYHRNSQAWEHQALVKGRIVAGASTQLESEGLIETIDEFSKPGWFEEVESGIEQAAYEWEIPEDLASQIHHLRSRKEKELSAETDKKRNLKEGRGGLLDVEFMTQYLQLVHGRDIPEMRTTETLKALENAGKHGLLNHDQVSILSEGYRHLRLIENGLRLLYDDSTNMLDFDRIDQPLILMLLKRHGYETEDLFKTVEKTTSSIRQVYSEIMERA
ncbi:MAG: bifunctional [glutamate--ammonia ligase]-adenylyl-L-tyrosine phosphorylase/[glutamate--ammonia-ligase] adenylyltransferase, partial [SAR324 cluster bacterium]|nr:bifunctional [glutamate--ammonia ligase]-adenylyl-L-tyrosine phosphorylase/[glutamate--ammonia-ligase] adenylyltransferase [SAR324 cluster bacterium]